MAIALEFANVIVRKSVVDQHYRGGVDAMARLKIPNFVEDENLARVGYMSTHEAGELAALLHDGGVDTSGSAVVTSVADAPGWLSVGRINGRLACWLAGEPPSDLIEFPSGFLLNCPAALIERLKALLDANEITISRASGLDWDHEDDEILICTRGETVVVLNLFPSAEGSRIGAGTM